MLPRLHDPIIAIATPTGRGAVGIVRVSGGDLARLTLALCGRALTARRATALDFRAADGSVIDHGLALFFAAPHSYTGEDVLELQAHGGTVLLQMLVARCLEAAAESQGSAGTQRLPGLRLAEPGEFSARAFLNGKLDLAQAEAVADLIDASTEAAARSAARSLSGEFSREVGALSEQVVALRTLVEATLDFPEEEIDFLQRADADGRLRHIAATLDSVLARTRQGALLREGLHVVLAGQPNVGKSSLLNALAGAELSIVTPTAGTTRDRIGQTIQVEGVPVHVVDIAGLRPDHELHDEVERIGVQRGWQAIAQADLVIHLHDLTRIGQADHDAADAAIVQQLEVAGVHAPLPVYNKSDATAVRPAEGIVLSARTGEGLDLLRRTLLQRAGWSPAGEGVFIARSRHVQALSRARDHVWQAQELASRGDAALDLLAEELRLAHHELGAVVGVFTTDDLLGEIFGKFCIGK